MSFPNRAPEPVAEPPAALLQGLGLAPEAVLRNRQAWFAVYRDEQQVRALAPDLQALRTLAPLDVVVTAPGREQDFASRYFWPANGGAEDPVTGSIHAGLARTGPSGWGATNWWRCRHRRARASCTAGSKRIV